MSTQLKPKAKGNLTSYSYRISRPRSELKTCNYIFNNWRSFLRSRNPCSSKCLSAWVRNSPSSAKATRLHWYHKIYLEAIALFYHRVNKVWIRVKSISTKILSESFSLHRNKDNKEMKRHPIITHSRCPEIKTCLQVAMITRLSTTTKTRRC